MSRTSCFHTGIMFLTVHGASKIGVLYSTWIRFQHGISMIARTTIVRPLWVGSMLDFSVVPQLSHFPGIDFFCYTLKRQASSDNPKINSLSFLFTCGGASYSLKKKMNFPCVYMITVLHPQKISIPSLAHKKKKIYIHLRCLLWWLMRCELPISSLLSLT